MTIFVSVVVITALVVPENTRWIDGVTGRPMEGRSPGSDGHEMALVLVLVYSRLGEVITRQSPECLMTPGILLMVRMVRHFTPLTTSTAPAPYILRIIETLRWTLRVHQTPSETFDSQHARC